MKYFCIFILTILILFLYFIFKPHIIEGFYTNNKTYILLGDSILKNNAYVKDGNSVENLLIKNDPNINLYSFAEDHSKIIDVYNQISKIPIELNNNINTYVFLSAGGNDILTHYVDRNEDITDTSVLKDMFISYKNLVKSISNRIPNAKIVLLDIYYPDTLMGKYKPFHSIIKEWNDMIYDFASKPSNNIYSVIKISNQLTQEEDFSFGIEPSSNGAKKIVNLILTTY